MLTAPPTAHRGFSLLELLIVLALIATISAIAAPPLGTAVGRHAVTAELEAIERAFHRARQAATRSGHDAVICASPDGDRCAGAWTDGWVAFVNADGDRPPHRDASELRLDYRRPASAVRLTANRAVFRIRADWQRSTNGSVAACDRAGRAEPRGLIVSYTGRPRRVDAAALRSAAVCP